MKKESEKILFEKGYLLGPPRMQMILKFLIWSYIERTDVLSSSILGLTVFLIYPFWTFLFVGITTLLH